MNKAEAKKNKHNLWGVDLQGADLREADLQMANLWGADLQRADLWGTKLPEDVLDLNACDPNKLPEHVQRKLTTLLVSCPDKTGWIDGLGGFLREGLVWVEIDDEQS